MNLLQLAVAGGRKTESVVDRCAGAPAGTRVLVLTYTKANQDELRRRISSRGPMPATVEVRGWFSFLLSHWIRPYLPLFLSGRRLSGLNFDGDPGMYATGENRYLDSEGRAYRLHLGRLAVETAAASAGAVMDRLCRLYDEIYVDEVQDLNGYDLEILKAILEAPVHVHLVGDVRQALLLTNPRDPKNAQYKGIRIKEWFDAVEADGLLEVEHSAITWRSNQQIADFADSIFGAAWGFSQTQSENHDETEHDGLFVVRPEHVDAYASAFAPLCLRHSAASAKTLDLPFMNFGIAKGRTADRVLIAPTGPIAKFLRDGSELEDFAACCLYVAVTRARWSVCFVTDQAGKLPFPRWEP